MKGLDAKNNFSWSVSTPVRSPEIFIIFILWKKVIFSIKKDECSKKYLNLNFFDFILHLKKDECSF